MGSTSFKRDDYAIRSSLRAVTARSKGISLDDATFAYTSDIKSGKAEAKVHPSLSPKGIKIRESRDSVAHPVTIPIILTLDTTGSMSTVPYSMQKDLCKLMGHFLEDKASGKKYIGDAYPAILVSAVDDYDAMRNYGGEGALQVGQFESGIEIDDNLTNLWITHNGGCTYQENYDLALYFAGNHTAHDHYDKRGRKGYMFIIGDEQAYDELSRKMLKDVFGIDVQADVLLTDVLEQAKELYNIFFIIPNTTSHYSDPQLFKYWVKLLGQQNVLKLADPKKICELIVSTVALCEEYIGVDDLKADGIDAGIDSKALALLTAVNKNVGSYTGAGLPTVPGSSSGSERL
jgi:hypothetical protein